MTPQLINPHYSIPEPQLVSSDDYFNDWFGISYKDEYYINHIQSPQPSEILSLYRIRHLIPLYPSILSAPIIRQLVLHINQRLSTILLSTHHTHYISYSHNKFISYCFHLQSIPSSLTWKEVYVADKEKALIFHHFLHHQPLRKNTLSYFPAQYRSTVDNNTLGIIEGRLVFYEPVPTTIKEFVVL